MENEIKEVIYIAISAIVLSLVLGIVSFVGQVNEGVSEVRTNTVVANRQLQQYNKYNKYDKSTVIGDEVIECIRLYYNTGIDIFVSSRTNVSSNSTVDGNNKGSCYYCDDSGDHRLFNMSQFRSHVGSSKDYFKVQLSAIDRPVDDLRNWFPTDAEYRAYLVYNSIPVATYYENIRDNAGFYGHTISESEIDDVDSVIKDPIPGSEVTGIVFIKIR